MSQIETAPLDTPDPTLSPGPMAETLYEKCVALARNLWWSGHPEVINLFRDLTVAPNIKKAYHLVAIDENRDAFVPSLMNRDPGRIEEVWFPGVHSDVGGGYDPRRLADTTLHYMMARAGEHGVKFHPSAAEGRLVFASKGIVDKMLGLHLDTFYFSN